MSANAPRLLPRFCEVTGHLCGTDTVHNDEPGCSCRQCMLWCREELKRRWLDMDRQRAENEKLRIALSDCANYAAGFRCTSGVCSTEFLLNVPEEVRAQIGARERDRDANRAGMQRLEAERDAALQKLAVAEASRYPAAAHPVPIGMTDARWKHIRGYLQHVFPEWAVELDVLFAETAVLRLELEAAEQIYTEESSRNCDAERALQSALMDVLGSATPHPVEHPSMWRTWRKANELLGRDPDTHVIPTSDKELERRIMSGGTP